MTQESDAERNVTRVVGKAARKARRLDDLTTASGQERQVNAENDRRCRQLQIRSLRTTLRFISSNERARIGSAANFMAAECRSTPARVIHRAAQANRWYDHQGQQGEHDYCGSSIHFEGGYTGVLGRSTFGGTPRHP